MDDMWPVIFKFGPFNLYSFGVFLFAAVVIGLFVSWKKIREYHIDDQLFFDISIQTLFWGLVGARAVYIIEHSSAFGFNLLKWLWFTHFVGLSMWGAIIGGILALFVLTRGTRKDFFEWLDVSSLGLSLGLGVGRIASLLNGSGMGKNVNWGVRMVGSEDRVFPVQILEMLGLFILFGFLWRVEKKYRTFSWYRAGKNSAKSGFLWFGFLVGLGVIFLVSSFGYQRGFISLRAWAGIALIVGSVGLYWRSGRSFQAEFKRKLSKS